MQAVILAGGLGTRLGTITMSTPKAMALVNGRPFLEYEVSLLRENGVDDLVLCVGHMSEQIEDHFGEGDDFGVRIRYVSDGPRLLGAAGALKRALPLVGESFFVTYGDAYLRLDYPALMARLSSSSALGVMAVYRNGNRHGNSDLVVRDGRVVRYDKRHREEGMDWINFGVSALRREALDLIPSGRPCDEEEFYGEMIRRGQLRAFGVTKRFYEIGTPHSLQEFERFVARRPSVV